MPYPPRYIRISCSHLINNVRPPPQFIPSRSPGLRLKPLPRPTYTLINATSRRFQSTISSTFDPAAERATGSSSCSSSNKNQKPPPLGKLPLVHLLRSLLLHTVSSSPALLSLTSRILLRNVDNLGSPLSPLRFLIHRTFYKHFCGGENAKEIRCTVGQLKELGVRGVILAYARELDVEDTMKGDEVASVDNDVIQIAEWREINQWLDGNFRTIEYSPPGDFVAIKFRGAGRAALRLLSAKPPQNPEMNRQLAEGIERMCDFAMARNVKLLLDAEQQSVQAGIDQWSLDLMRKYNKNPESPACIYNTYQMYLRASPSTLREHISLASKEDFKLGVKIVRGAYLSTDPRDLICETKEDTDRQYDEAVEMMMSQRSARIDLVLASHNKESVMKAVSAYSKSRSGTRNKEEGGVNELVFAQLMGMADELSFGLVDTPLIVPGEGQNEGGRVKVYKYVTWGSIPECVKYLLRRAEENKQAVGRSRENMMECWTEIRRRIIG